MKTRQIILLSILLVGGLLYIWRFEQSPLSSSSSSEKEQDLQQPVFPDLLLKNISHVAISFGQTKTELKKETVTTPQNKQIDIWRLPQKGNAEADLKSVATLFRAFVQLKAHNIISRAEQASDKSEYGLTAPELVLQFTDLDGEHGLTFGSRNPFSARRYAVLSGREDILLVDDIVTALSKRDADLRLRQAFTFNPAAVHRCKIELFDSEANTTEIREFKRTSQSNWTVTQTAAGQRSILLGDNTEIVNVLTHLSSLQVQGFVERAGLDIASLGLTTPAIRGELEISSHPDIESQNDAAKEVVRFAFGLGTLKSSDGHELISEEIVEKNAAQGRAADEKKLYLQVEGSQTIYLVDSAKSRVFAELKRSLLHFRDRHVFQSLDQNQVSKLVVIEKGSMSGTLTKESNGHWFAVRGEVASAETPQLQVPKLQIKDEYLQKWISKLSTLEVLSYVVPGEGDADEMNLNSPQYELRISQGEQTYRLVFGSPLESATSESSEEEVDSNQVPRYAGVSLGGTDLMPVLVSWADWKDLAKPLLTPEFIQPQ